MANKETTKGQTNIKKGQHNRQTKQTIMIKKGTKQNTTKQI